MAEAYRGLTIRIGADTSNLRSAMTNLKSASNALQRDFRKLSNAFRVDPHNADLARARVKTLGNATGAAAAEAARLNRALKEAGHVPGFKDVGASMEQLANHTRNAQVQAAHARDSYNLLDKRLESLYNTIAKNNLGANATKEKLEEERARVKALAHDYDNLSRAKRTEFNSYLRGLAGENPLGLQTMRGKAASGATYISVFKSLREEWRKTYAELQKADAAVGLENIANDALLAESRIRQLQAEFTALRLEELRIGTGKIKELAGDIDRASERAREAQSRIERMDEALRLDPHNIDAASQKMLAFKERSEATERELKLLNQRMDEMRKQGFDKAAAEAKALKKSVKQVSDEFTEANSKVERLSGELEEARLEVERVVKKGRMIDFKKAASEVNRLETELNQAEREAEQVRHEFELIGKSNAWHEVSAETATAKSRLAAYNRELKETNTLARMNLGKSMKNMGYAMLSTVTPMLMMGGMYMVQAADDIDAAYRNMRKTVNGTENDFENLREEAMKFASTHMTSTDQILEIESIGGQLGIAVENLQAFGETVANLDIATNMDTETIAADLGKIGSVLGMSVDDYDNFGDALVRLGNNMPAFESDIMTITTRFMGMGKVVGMSAPEMLAWATAATATGQKAEAAGSSMQRFISNMETAVANGTDKLEIYARVAGMSAEEFAAKFREDASGAMYEFIEGLGNLQRNGESVNQTLAELGINNVRDKQLLEGLANQMANTAGSSSLLNDALIMSQDAWNGVSDQWGAAGDAAREAGRKAEGFSGQLQILKNNGQILGAELAEGLAPILSFVNSVVQDLTSTFSAFPDSTKSWIVGITAMTMAFGPILVLNGVLMTSWNTMKDTVTSMGGAWEKTAKKVANANSALGYDSVVSHYDRLGNEIRKVTTYTKDANGNLVKTTKTVRVASGAFKKLSSAVKLAGTSFGPMLAITAVVAAIAAVAGKVSEYKERVKEFEHATKGLVDASRELNDASELQEGRVSALSGEYDRANVSIEEMVEQMGSNADAMHTAAYEANISVGQLEEYRSIIHHAATDAEWAAENQGLLEYALKGVNDATGQAWTAQDILSGEYENQIGLIDQVIDAEERLIQKRAAETVLTESTEAAITAEAAYKTASKEYNRLYEDRKRFIDQARSQGYDVQTVEGGNVYAYDERGHQVDSWTQGRELREAKKERDEANKARADAQDAVASAQEAVNEYGMLANSADEIATYLNSANVDIFENIPDAQVFEEAGISVEDFSGALETLGVPISELQNMDIASLFNAFKEHGLEGLADELEAQGYSAEMLAENLDGVQERLMTINGEKAMFVVSDDGTVEDIYGNLLDVKYFEIGDKHFYIDDDNTIYEAETGIRAVNQEELYKKYLEIETGGAELDIAAITGRDYDILITADADTRPAAQDINSVASRDYHSTINVGANTNKLTRDLNNYFNNNSWRISLNANVKVGGRAAGGIIGHAAGGFNGIVRRPILTNQGLIGEAGAEAVMRWAGGTAIVPLENHQYVRPFAQSVAQEMPMAFGAYGGVTAGEIAAALANMNLQVRMDSGELVGVLVNNSRRRAAMNV